jgi:transcriptional regulator with XRE-family HTH domain
MCDMKIKGEMLKSFRERECQTQADVANKLKLTRAMVNRLENDNVGASSATVERICKFIGCKRTELVVREEA